MPRQIFTAPIAAVALAEALARFSQPGAGRVARAISSSLEQVPRRLRDNPYEGMVSRERPGLRLLVVAGHRFFYVISNDTGDAETAGDIAIITVLPPGKP